MLLTIKQRKIHLLHVNSHSFASLLWNNQMQPWGSELYKYSLLLFTWQKHTSNAHTQTYQYFKEATTKGKNKRQDWLNQCIPLQVAPFPHCPVMLHAAVFSTSIPLVASLRLPAGLLCANLLRVWIVVLIFSAQRHGHDWLFHTPTSSQQTDMAAVSSSCCYSCYHCLAYSPPLLLQSFIIPQADVRNTDDSSASLIWNDSAKRGRGVVQHCTNGRLLSIRICTEGDSASGQWGETTRKRCFHIHDVYQRARRANRARWHLITQGKHKEAPQPAAGLFLEGRVEAGGGRWSRVNPPTSCWGFSACYTCLKFVWKINCDWKWKSTHNVGNKSYAE